MGSSRKKEGKITMKKKTKKLLINQLSKIRDINDKSCDDLINKYGILCKNKKMRRNNKINDFLYDALVILGID